MSRCFSCTDVAMRTTIGVIVHRYLIVKYSLTVGTLGGGFETCERATWTMECGGIVSVTLLSESLSLLLNHVPFRHFCSVATVNTLNPHGLAAGNTVESLGRVGPLPCQYDAGCDKA